MTRIKICGITNAKDAQAAAEAGADALGVIAVPESPRYVRPEDVHDVFGGLGPFTPVVVVARTAADGSEYLNPYPGPIQFYDGPPDPHRPAIRVFRIRDTHSLTEIADYVERVDALLLDTFHETALGGIGHAFDWSVAVAAKSLLRGRKLILAGGLTPDNVGGAVRAVRPFAVDVSSGVEAEPGRKDHGKLQAFIQAVRQADLDFCDRHQTP